MKEKGHDAGRDGEGLTLSLGVTGINTAADQCQVVAAKEHFDVTDSAIAKVCSKGVSRSPYCGTGHHPSYPVFPFPSEGHN